MDENLLVRLFNFTYSMPELIAQIDTAVDSDDFRSAKVACDELIGVLTDFSKLFQLIVDNGG